MKKKLVLLGSAAVVFFAACAMNSGVSSEQIGLRKASLENENKVNLVEAISQLYSLGNLLVLSVLMKMHHH